MCQIIFLIHCIFTFTLLYFVGRDRIVVIAIRYGLKVGGSNPGEGKVLRLCSEPPWCAPSLLHNGYPVSFPGMKRLGRGVDHPSPSSAEVKERA